MAETRFYNITEAALEVSLSPHTIRAWEKRYGALTPLRATNGNRLYTEEDMIRLRLLVGLVNLGSSIGQIVHLTTEELKAVSERFRQKTQRLFGDKKKGFDVRSIESDLLISSRTFDLRKVGDLLEQASREGDARIFALDIVPSLLRGLDFYRMMGDLTGAQVSVIIALLRFHAGHLIHRTVTETRTGPLYVLTGFDSEHQEMGLLQTALLFGHHQKNFLYLNSHLPTAALNEALKTTGSRQLVVTLNGEPPAGLLSDLREDTEVLFVGKGHQSLEDLDKILSSRNAPGART